MKKRLFTLILCLSLVSCIAPDMPVHQSVITPTAGKPVSIAATSQVDVLLKGKCEKVWENPIGPGVSNFLRNTYDDMGCKYSLFSPNRDYLAYVTLSYTAPKTPYVDTVKIIDSDTGTDKPIHFSNSKDFIGDLEWTPTGKLLIWELIWEGPWVIFLYDPVVDSTVYIFRLDQNGQIEWNPQGTMFYASHLGEYGRDNCVTELSGYDFQFNNSFPDFYEIYGLEKSDDPFGIPYGKITIYLSNHLRGAQMDKVYSLLLRLLPCSKMVYIIGKNQNKQES